MIEKLKKEGGQIISRDTALILALPLFFILLVVAVIVFFPTPFEDENKFEELYERFDRIETGIVNASIDFCFSNGGTYLTDPSGNLVVQESNFLDQNTGQTIRVRFIPCILKN